MAKPLISTIVAVGALAALASPVLDLHTKGQDLNDLPPKAPVVQALTAIDASFPSKSSPAEVVVQASTVRGEDFDQAVAAFTKAATDARLVGPIEVRTNPAGTVAVVSVGLPGTDSLTVLRDDVVPATLGRLPGATALVTGEAAQGADFNDRLSTSMPWVFGFVLGLAFLLLLVFFRSVTVAITGVALNLLSVAAAYGMLVYVFQYGHFEDLLQFKASGGIINWIPLFLFIILFGLSMDYHVFVLSRIRESYDQGMPTRQAIRDGIGRTAGVITSAGVVMVAVFALFALLPLASTKQLGIGLAAAVLLDATIIRAVLLPAVMALLGEKNWWLPGWLAWLPQIAHEPPPAPEQPVTDDRELLPTA
ncbi:MMPL family transporter [Micromonosporaceae bacterium Da 78-11]